jgi:hypothetical protein
MYGVWMERPKFKLMTCGIIDGDSKHYIKTILKFDKFEQILFVFVQMYDRYKNKSCKIVSVKFKMTSTAKQ